LAHRDLKFHRSDAACQRMIATILVSDVTLASNSQLCRTDPQEWQVV
jgi:hypothetical protein